MNNLKKNIIGITIGIRYGRSFRVPDISGDIIDHILYSEDTPFGTGFFPNVQENSNREKTLFNKETSEYLRINSDDFILAIEINNDFDKKFKWLKKEVIPYFANHLFKNYKIKNIKRFGIIFSHKIQKNKKLTNTIETFTNNEITDADNVSISFSKKAATTESLFRKGVNDYKNRIYNFQEFNESIQVDLDYQYYYEPIIEDLRECFIDKILDEANTFLENNFYKWIDEYEEQKK